MLFVGEGDGSPAASAKLLFLAMAFFVFSSSARLARIMIIISSAYGAGFSVTDGTKCASAAEVGGAEAAGKECMVDVAAARNAARESRAASAIWKGERGIAGGGGGGVARGAFFRER